MNYMTKTDVYNSNQFADNITLNLLCGVALVTDRTEY
jgi:hypothetical protein